jgi:hypothetical protein
MSIIRMFVRILRAIRGSPSRAAVSFALSAIMLSAIVAALENRLMAAETGVQPFIKNVSTIVDFLILDPLMIAAFLSAVRSIRDIGINLPDRFLIPPSVAGGFGVMAAYYGSFSFNGFRDALILGPGLYGITATGWVVFFFTAVVMSVVFYALFAQAIYIGYVRRLAQCDISYRPLHMDGCAGLRSRAAPAWYMLNGLVLLLLVFMLFYVQDNYINHIKRSLRLEGFVVYLIIAPLVFLAPVYHLRRLMLQHRSRLISKVDTAYDSLCFDQLSLAPADAGTVEGQIAALIRLRSTVSAFPTWPLPVPQLAQSVAYYVGPLTGTVLKLAPSVSKYVVGI